MRAWRSSRERVADASSRHFAAPPSRLLVVATTTHASLNFELTSTLHLLSSRSPLFSSCTPYLYTVLMYHFAWPGESSLSRRNIHIFVARPRPLLSRFIPMCSLSDSRRIYVALRLYQPVRRSAFALNRISLLSDETPHYLLLRVVRRGLDCTPALRPCLLALFFIFSLLL